MKLNYVFAAALLVATQLASVQSVGWKVVKIAKSIAELISDAAREAGKVWAVEVHNEGKHHAHMWCESKDDKIGGSDGLWVKPGEKIAWAFRRTPSTQFWCNMDWYGQRVGWDVYVRNWKDAPNPTKWSIKNDGVYDHWKNRKWRNLKS